jgi:hypothetical protein
LPHSDDRLIRDLIFNYANRFPQQGDRPRFALGKISPRFLSLLGIVASLSDNEAKRGAVQRDIRNEGTAVEPRGEVKSQVRRGAVPKCCRQGFVDACFKRNDFRDTKSPLHFLGFKSLKALDAFPKPLDTIALLFQGEDRRCGLLGKCIHARFGSK